jgi:hypothetical protein
MWPACHAARLRTRALLLLQGAVVVAAFVNAHVAPSNEPTRTPRRPTLRDENPWTGGPSTTPMSPRSAANDMFCKVLKINVTPEKGIYSISRPGNSAPCLSTTLHHVPCFGPQDDKSGTALALGAVRQRKLVGKDQAR